MKKIILSSIFVFIGLVMYSQSEIQLAINYYNSKEYDKAEVLFDKLYKKNKSYYYFDYYIDCLIFQEKFDAAEKRLKKEIKKNPNSLIFYVNLGYLQKITNEQQNAEKQFKYVLKNLTKNKSQISQIGNIFIKRNEYGWAEKVYLKGNEFFPNNYTTSLITIYSLQRNNDKLIDSYLNYVETDNSQIGFVEKNLKVRMTNDVNDEFTHLLEQKLIMRIQKGKNMIFNELLIWYYTVKIEFSKALIQAQAMDRKNKENGVRVYRIGQSAFENDDYKTAQKAYQYVVNKGDYYPYYFNSKFGLLKVLYAKVQSGMINTPEEILDVETKYLSMINELGVSSRTVDLIVDLAHLQAFYMNKETAALELLQQGLEIGGLNGQLKAKFLMELGDVYLHSSKPWDAVLTYAKIENNFPNLEITDIAKFKKAKIYFYLGQFQWAQQQWDVLKGSPSKLIANDAIYWSNFITENSDDSTQTSLKKYSRAELAFFEGKNLKSLAICDSLIKENAGYSVTPFVYHLKYEIYFSQKDYITAAKNLQIVVDDFSFALWTDKAIFELAHLYETKLNDSDKAKELYKKLLFNYKSSIYSSKARESFKKLSENQL